MTEPRPFEVLTLRVRIIVIGQLPEEEQNAMLHLFIAREDLIRYGQEHYHPRTKNISTLLYQLLILYTNDESITDKQRELIRQSVDDFW